MSSISDFTIASWAAGFTLGFGILTVWTAYKQTMAIKSPLRSVYIYMVWGEILVNLVIAIIGWLFLNGNLSPTVPVLFSILFCWVFEVQLLMQIIINRIAVVEDNRKKIRMAKWGTAAIITFINVAVFCIWIPSHVVDPIPIFVSINKYWDRASKVLILLVDAVLNWWFLRIVNQRLVKYHGLTKYAPLIRFNARLMVLSIAMDLMLIGLMSLQNQVVYIQFHPVAYMVKLNIEMTMAGLITKIARGSVNDRNEFQAQSSTHDHTVSRSRGTEAAIGMRSGIHTSAVSKPHVASDREDIEGIRTTKEVHIRVENAPSFSDSGSLDDAQVGYDSRPAAMGNEGDLPLRHNGIEFEFAPTQPGPIRSASSGVKNNRNSS